LFIFSSLQRHGNLFEQFSESQAAFQTTFRVTGGYLKAGTSFLKRVTGKIFKLVSDFMKHKQKPYFQLLCTKRQPDIAKTISADTKETDLNLRTTLKKIHLVTLIR
jgi:hypothetical protein